jgi:hypothetical protein
VRLYLGGAALDAVADAELNGEADGDSFGFATAGAGDVDGDGHSDVIVGAWGNDGGGSDAGRAYLYLGAPSGVLVTSQTYSGVAGGAAGELVAGSDVDGDDLSDPIVDVAGVDGQIWMFHGVRDALPLGPPVLTLGPEPSGSSYGASLTVARDLDGDRRPDVVVCDHTFASVGRCYFYLSTPTLDDVADATLDGDVWDQLGSATTAVDLDGDGFDELAIGGSFDAFNPGPLCSCGTWPARVYVLDGGAGWDALPDATLEWALEERREVFAR